MTSECSTERKSERKKHHCRKSNKCCPEYNPCSETIFPPYVSLREISNLPFPFPLPPCIPYNPYDTCNCRNNYQKNKCCKELFCGKYYPCKCTKCGTIMISLAVTTQSPSFSSVGERIIFNYEVKNIGNGPFTKRLLICDELNGNFGIEKLTLQQNIHRTLTQSYYTTQEDVNRGMVTNITTAYIALNGERYVYSPRVQTNIPYVQI